MKELINGIININKPLGITSHTVVSRVRRILSMKRVGHTGTLDPEASGVLPICVGMGTKAADMLTNSDKQYRAVLKLGVTTDTQDAVGTVMSTQHVNLTEGQIHDAVNSFVGNIQQIPPMYSAIKKDGKKLYELARAGIEVERAPRDIVVYSIAIESINSEFVTLLVDCSKGTYIRTLCHDIGNKLGCGGIMNALERTRVGDFYIQNSYTLEQLEQLGPQCIIPLTVVFKDYSEFIVNDFLEQKVRNGVPITAALADGMYRVVDEKGSLLCVSECKDGLLTMQKSFWSD